MKCITPGQRETTIPGIELYETVDGIYFKDLLIPHASPPHNPSEIMKKLIIFILFIPDREVNLAATLILENFAMPTNRSGASTPVSSRYSSTDNVHGLNSASPSSVAERARMFELNASVNENFSTSPKLRLNASTDGSKSPRFSSSPQKNPSKGY